MKKVLMAAVALTAVTATPAFAEDFAVTGKVAATCNYTGGTIAFGTIQTNADGTLVANQKASSTAQTGFYCNGGSTKATVTHSPLSSGTGAAATGFVNSIGFTPVVSIGGVDVVTGDASGASISATSGSLVVRADNLTASGKVQAGDYTGQIVLTLTPGA